MSGEPYLDLAFGVQALRRQVDRDAHALCGALGIAARHLPHQVGNVARILSAHRVRHLLADEVGMGKTIQALMVINALRLQDPSLSVLIIVPDGLREQWRDEHLTRAHHSPIEEAPTSVDDRRVRLAWPQVLKNADIDPARYDFLVVDEFHSLRGDIQQRILATSADFTHLLLISATPPFHDQQRLGEILRMLEPERAALLTPADEQTADLVAILQTRERMVDKLLRVPPEEPSAWAPYLRPPPAEAARETAALAHCWLRGVIRTRRKAFREYMPLREHHAVDVEPVEAEVERQRLMWSYFHYLGDMSRDFDLDLLAQRVIRSPASLRQRVTYLRGHGHEREGILEQVAPLLGAEQGDSRLDALCDLLASLWHKEPDVKILVAAGDNLTVDDLAKRLPQILDVIGPPGDRRVLEPVRIRNQTRGSDTLIDEDEISRAVRQFVAGEANLMLAADVGKLGLNLQVTRHIVLYSIPWDPQEVEQWIGRVDRIGNTAAISQVGLWPIVVHTISQRGLVDERIVQVIKATSILERSISLDSAAVEGVRASIRRVALGRDTSQWKALLRAAATLRGAELDELDAPLFRALPWTPERAKDLHRLLDEGGPVEPALVRPGYGTGLRGREEALLGWLLALRAAREYDIRRAKPSENRPQSLGHVVLDRPDAWGANRTIVQSSVQLSREVAAHPRRPVYFFIRRSQLKQPPQREYLWENPHRPDSPPEPNPIHFLDHGSPLHEEIVHGWLARGASGDEYITLLLPPEHPLVARFRGKKIALWIGDLDPAHLLGDVSQLIDGELLAGLDSAAELLSDPRLAAARYADERFIRLHLKRQLLCTGALLSPSGAQALPREHVHELLTSTSNSKSFTWERPPRWVDLSAEAAWENLAAAAAEEGRQRWSVRLPQLRAGLAQRRYVIDVQDYDAGEIAAGELRALKERLGELELELAGGEASSTVRGMMTRTLGELEKRGVEETRRAAAAELRRRWLARSEPLLKTLTPTRFRRAVLSIDALRQRR